MLYYSNKKALRASSMTCNWDR